MERSIKGFADVKGADEEGLSGGWHAEAQESHAENLESGGHQRVMGSVSLFVDPKGAFHHWPGGCRLAEVV
jgi:hypothetical protein